MLNLDKLAIKSALLHAGQKDKAGVDYFTGHIMTVVNSVDDPIEKAVAYLHDTMEDCGLTVVNALSILGVCDCDPDIAVKIVNAVVALTKQPGIDYAEYINKIKMNPIAKAVKIADILHNMDLTRLNVVTDEDLKRIDKYRIALKGLLL